MYQHTCIHTCIYSYILGHVEFLICNNLICLLNYWCMIFYYEVFKKILHPPILVLKRDFIWSNLFLSFIVSCSMTSSFHSKALLTKCIFVGLYTYKHTHYSELYLHKEYISVIFYKVLVMDSLKTCIRRPLYMFI